MSKAKQPTTDALKILNQRYLKNDPQMASLVAEERANQEIAQKIFDLRTKRRLSQQELAKLVGTTASVICRPGRRRLSASFPLHAASDCGCTQPARRDSLLAPARKKTNRLTPL
jgi:hypothetical protein